MFIKTSWIVYQYGSLVNLVLQIAEIFFIQASVLNASDDILESDVKPQISPNNLVTQIVFILYVIYDLFLTLVNSPTYQINLVSIFLVFFFTFY